MACPSPDNQSRLARLSKALREKRVPAAACPACGEPDAVIRVSGLPARWSFGGAADYMFGACRDCGEICELRVVLESMAGDLSCTARTFPVPQVSVSTIRLQEPSLRAREIEVPPYLPRRVTSLFRQARHNLVLENWDAAGMTYRKALEIALREKFGFGARMRLARMIKTLASKEPAMFQVFAELLRMAGNEAAHDREFTRAGAGLLDSHMEQLVVYLFTVPAIKQRAEGD